MKKKLLIVLTALALILCACGEKSTTLDNIYGGREQLMAPEASLTNNVTANKSDSQSENAASEIPAAGQKLIKRLYYTLESKEFDNANAELRSLCTECGGYIENSSLSGNTYGSKNTRSATYVFRIPVSEVGVFEEKIQKTGNVSSFKEEIEDISLSYADTASKVQALEIQRDRLMAMMEEADNLADLLTIQDHLSEVEYQLESYASKLRLYDNLVEYTTVSVTLREVQTYTEPKPQTFGERIGQTFRSSLKRVGEFFEDAAIGIFGNLPSILTAAGIIALIGFAGSRIVKSHKKKQAKKQQAVVPLQEPPEIRQ